jgi:1-acyl-sn-glycerol-3-phosphate acyltransferase
VTELTYSAIIRLARLTFRALAQQITITGLEHLPRTGGAVVAVNHISYVDFIYGGLPVVETGQKPRFMAKRELFDHRVTGPVMRTLRHIEVDRTDGESSLAVALDCLRRGEVVGIFPEATISRAMEIKALKTGAARIAAAAAAPLVPVVLWGTQRMMTKDHDRDLSRGKAITITVGPPVPLSGDAVADTASLRSSMGDLLDRAIRSYPQHEPGAWWVPASYGGTAPTLEQAAVRDAEERAVRAARRAGKSN